MRRYIRRNDLPDSRRRKLDFVLSVYGPGMKEATQAANRFVASYNASHNERIEGGHASIVKPDPAYQDISLIRDASKLPDVIGGMGFGEFLGADFRRRFVDTREFEDFARPGAVSCGPGPGPLWGASDAQTTLLPWHRPDGSAEGDSCRTFPISVFDGVDLVDASGSYHIFGGSAFTMLVDTRKLGGLPVPRSWADILDPAYYDLVVCGFNIDDINEIPLLYIYRMFGDDGLAAFADNLSEPVDTLDMMRMSLRKRNTHAVFLLPWFFAEAAPREDFLIRVWPSEGALLAPYYVLARNTDEQRVRDILDFFYGQDLADSLAGKNMLHVCSEQQRCELDGRRLAWLGWDWLLARDIIETMAHIDSIVVPRVLAKHPELAASQGRALWNG